MREEIIQTLKDPDPGFVKILEKIPDAEPSLEQKIIEALPKLQEFFRQKRDAFRRQDMTTFQRILSDEILFVRDLGPIAFSS